MKTNEKIRAVIFDLDGTLANTLPLCIKAFRKSIEPLINKNLSDEDIIATFGPSEEGTIMALAPDHYEKGISAYLHYYQQLHEMCSTPFPGMEDVLIMLKANSVRIGMVTGKGPHSTKISLDHFNLTRYFEFIETGSSAGARKTAGIREVVNKLNGINKKEIIYVGDAPSDIIASRENNIKMIAAAWAETAEPEKLKSFLPDEIFYTVKDFTNWLKVKIGM